MYSDNWIPARPGHCLAAVGTARNVIPIPKISSLLGSVSTWFLAIKSLLVKLRFVCSFTIYFCQKFLALQFASSLKRNCTVLPVLRQCFWNGQKRLELRALCFPPDQLASSLPRCHGSSYLTDNTVHISVTVILVPSPVLLVIGQRDTTT